MWKVIIADDEPKIRSGLSDMILQMNLDLIVCGTAQNGEQALEMTRENKPDIILVDICMPILNGLDLIKKIKEENIQCKIIVISGHDEFEYAQESIKLEVFEYLLKPIVELELFNVILKAIKDIEALYSQERYLEIAKNQFRLHSAYLKEYFLKQWLLGSMSEQELEENMELFEVLFPPHAVLFVVSRQQNYSNANYIYTSVKDEHLLGYTILNIISELLMPFDVTFLFINDEGHIIGLLNDESSYLDKLSSQIQETVFMSTGLKVTAFCTNTTYEYVSESYGNLLEKVKSLAGCDHVIISAIEFINMHYMEQEFELSILANKLHMNPSYLSRLMKQQLGVSFIDFLTGVRINKAAELMQNKKFSINQVAEMVGYSTQHYFSTAFKKVFGVTPVDYRKSSGEMHKK